MLQPQLFRCRICSLIIALAMTGLNYSGLDIVGRASEVIVVAVVLPFLALAVLAVPQMDVSRWAGTKPLGDIHWINYLNVMFWNLNSWDCISTLAGEVRNPTRLFPRALFFAVVLVRSPPTAPASPGDRAAAVRRPPAGLSAAVWL